MHEGEGLQLGFTTDPKKSHSHRVGFLFAVSFFLFLKSLYLFVVQIDMVFKLFAILQKYDFSSKSQRNGH